MIYSDIAQCTADLQRDIERLGQMLRKVVGTVPARLQPTLERLLQHTDEFTDTTAPYEGKVQLQLSQQPQELVTRATRFINEELELLRSASTEVTQLTRMTTGSAAPAAMLAQLALALARIIGRLEIKAAYYAQVQSGLAVGAGLQDLRGSVDTVTTYPVLTREIGGGGNGYGNGSAATSGGSSIGVAVDRAMKQVLGWRPRGAEAGKLTAKGFVAALNQSFACETVDGRNVCTWTPRSYVVQADLGAVTGAQASLYSRAKVALDHALPILDGLEPLRPDADTEDVSASRLVARTHLVDLVNELGEPGGPRVQRVDALFESLLGPDVSVALQQPESVGGLLGNVKTEFGLSTDQVTTVAEEQTLTDFLILVDHVNSLLASWQSRRTFFDREGNEVYLGTELILLNRALAVTGESVNELRAAMDSVFLSEAERATTRLEFRRRNQPPLYVSEVLDWVQRFTGETGPRLIDDGGRAGVAALFPTIDRLVELCGDSRTTAFGGDQTPGSVPGGYATARVQNALDELVTQLTEVQLIAQRIRDGQVAVNGQEVAQR